MLEGGYGETNEDDENIDCDMADEIFTHEGLDELIVSQTPINQALHAHISVVLAQQAFFFHLMNGDGIDIINDMASNATGDGMSDGEIKWIWISQDRI